MNLTNYFGKISTIIIISNNKMINLVSKKKYDIKVTSK